MDVLSLEERKARLDQEISGYAKMGWRVVSRTDTTAQLTKDKTASCVVAIILALFLIVPAILYLLLYKGTESLYLEVDEEGKVTKTRS